jgi:hypothetical protein
MYRLFKNLPKLLKEMFEDSPDFFKKIIDTRDYFVHNNCKDGFKPFSDSEVYWLTKKIKLMFHCLILQKLGFANDDIYNRVNESQLFYTTLDIRIPHKKAEHENDRKT